MAQTKSNKGFVIIVSLLVISGGAAAYFLWWKPKAKKKEEEEKKRKEDEERKRIEDENKKPKDGSGSGSGDGGGGGGGSDASKTPFSNRSQGDAFRVWVAKYYPEYAKSISLDATGPIDNPTIRKAYKEYGEKYKANVPNWETAFDIPTKLKPFVERNFIDAKFIKSSPYGYYIPYTYKTDNGNAFQFRFLDTGYFKVDDKDNKIVYEGTFDDGARKLTITNDKYPYDNIDIKGTTVVKSSAKLAMDSLFLQK